MKKLLALTLSLLLVFAVVPMAMVSAEGTVAKIGDVEYASLFGADGALLNAVEGDRIVMVANEEYDYAPEKDGVTHVYISKAITLDLAGYTVNITRSNTKKGTVFSVNAAFSVVSTVDGLGVENTETKGAIKAVATIFSASAPFTANNVDLKSTLSDDSYGMALSVGATTTVTIKDCLFNAPKMAIRVTSGTPVFDVQDSTIYSQQFVLKNNSGKFSGTFKNCSIYSTGNTGPDIHCSELTFDNSNIYCKTSDQTMFTLRSGTLKLVNGTVLDGSSAAKTTLSVSSGATLVTDNATIKSPKSAASDAYALKIAGTASLGNTVISASTKANACALNLYSYLADGKAIYTSDIPSEETLVPKDYAPADYKVLYIRDSLEAAVTYDVTIDGEVVETLIEGKTFVVPAAAEGYHYTDGTTDYFEGDEIVVNANVDLVSEINSYSVTVDGEEVATINHGDTYEVPVAGTGYQYTDGATRYDGGEAITVTSNVELTKVVKLDTVTYTMDEGSRISGGSTANINDPGKFMEVDGNWVFALPSKADQVATFILPEDWYVKPYYKAINIKFSVSRTPSAASYNDYVNFTDNTDSISISNGYKELKSTYSVDVDSSNYGFRYFKTKLKGGTNYSSSDPHYIYIDDVTVTFEYDHDYVEPEQDGLTTDLVTTVEGASIRLGEVNGIRFYATVDESLDLSTVDEMGIIIAPKDKVGEYFTMDDDYAKVVYDHKNNELWEDNQYVGSIVNLKSSNSYNAETGNLARDFIARAYVVIDGVTYYAKTTCVRNIAGIADEYIAHADSGYANLDADIKALVDTWAAAND